MLLGVRGIGCSRILLGGGVSFVERLFMMYGSVMGGFNAKWMGFVFKCLEIYYLQEV